MGNNKSSFSEEELEDYEDLTFLTRKEILLAWEKWETLVGSQRTRERTVRYPEQAVQELAELKNNPFRERITRVFSSQRDSKMSFEDFLDLLSTMSESAPLHLKAYYAFHMFDYNEDSILDAEDLAIMVDKLTGEGALLPEEKKRLVDKLLEETDLDGGGISEEEFKHLLTKCPDFIHSFRFSI
ncbi:LOW QUALITY PROTEIN: calcium and integrin-binding protein 1 [Procambarus clarkii]|uniref:LOW QUALITY PROTEIN: calcium and integrin-binding protein 1 n=1 Tax=Procambarus clarkii TaxID=6728 RepID=UPI001E6736D1|nr:calcium and integrin-binding protein 1-like isoform X2 [Procambarus clarkii]